MRRDRKQADTQATTARERGTLGLNRFSHMARTRRTWAHGGARVVLFTRWDRVHKRGGPSPFAVPTRSLTFQETQRKKGKRGKEKKEAVSPVLGTMGSRVYAYDRLRRTLHKAGRSARSWKGTQTHWATGSGHGHNKRSLFALRHETLKES